MKLTYIGRAAQVSVEPRLRMPAVVKRGESEDFDPEIGRQLLRQNPESWKKAGAGKKTTEE